MSLVEIEQEVVKPLSRSEKLQLIADITRMLQEEEETTDPKLSQSFKKGATYPVFTPVGMEEAAAQLQKYLDQGVL